LKKQFSGDKIGQNITDLHLISKSVVLLLKKRYKNFSLKANPNVKF